MKNQNVILKINKPCSQNWNEMTPSGKGRFCDSCAKQVIDFSTMSDQQILGYIQKKEGSLCGRLAVNQMNRVLVSPSPSSLSSRFFRMLLSGLFLSQVEMSMGQSQAGYQHEKNFNDRDGIRPAKPNDIDRPTPIDTNKDYIAGIVLDSSTHETLVFANIYIKGTQYGVVTDTAGKFKLKIPETFKEDSITIIISYTGYLNEEILIQRQTLPASLTVYVNQSPLYAMGGMIVGGLFISRTRHWWEFWKRRH